MNLSFFRDCHVFRGATIDGVGLLQLLQSGISQVIFATSCCVAYVGYHWFLYYPSIHPSIYISIIYLWLYSPLLDFARFFNFLIYTKSVGLLGRGISPSQSLYLHTGQHRHRINVHRHPCLEWDSNPRSQCWSERKTVHALDCTATLVGHPKSLVW
jgi:hypothetical protein